MGKTIASYGPSIPESAKNQGATNHIPVVSNVKNERETAGKAIPHADGRIVQTKPNTRTDY